MLYEVITLRTGTPLATPALDEVEQILTEHLHALYAFYGEYMGVRIARKHVGWYLQQHDRGDGFRKRFNQLETTRDQLGAVSGFFAARTAA